MRRECYLLFALLPAVLSQNTSISSGRHQPEPATDLANDNLICPAWTVPDKTYCRYVKEEYYNEAIVCIAVNGSKPEVLLLEGFCITQNSEKTQLVFGSCPYYEKYDYRVSYYRAVPDNVDNICNTSKRTGQFCGQCMENYSPPVYSYDVNCVHCPNGTNNWAQYLAVSLLPTTIFFLLALIFRFRATSARLNVYIMVYQFFITYSKW